jgi:hypothetical protein
LVTEEIEMLKGCIVFGLQKAAAAAAAAAAAGSLPCKIDRSIRC